MTPEQYLAERAALEQLQAQYDAGRPTVSDIEFDRRLSAVKEHERAAKISDPASLTNRVGGSAPVTGAVRHAVPMLSIENSYTKDGVITFGQKIQDAFPNHNQEHKRWIVEPKYDGLALSLVYKSGKLVSAATRGDGVTGESALHSVMAIPDKQIPKVLKPIPGLPETIEIRGEVMLLLADFASINDACVNRNETPFVTARNAAAGIIRRKVPGDETRRLVFAAYGVSPETRMNGMATQLHALKLANALGFNVSARVKTADTIEEAFDIATEMGASRHALPYEIDGAVVKANHFEIFDQLGATSKFPRAYMAFKFNEQEAWTRIESIRVQVGRTGQLTPVANLTAVEIGGVSVTSATLHNQDEIDRLDIRVGDRVLVKRAGDVIPDIVEVDVTARPQQSAPYHLPEKCPCCDSPAAKDKEDSAAIKCTGGPSVCEEQGIGRLLHFASRDAMDIDGFGDVIAEQIWRNCGVRNVADLYKLTVDQVSRLDRMGKKSAENLINAIQASKSAELRRVLVGLGIHLVGNGTSKRLQKSLTDKTLSGFMVASEREMLAIKDIGHDTVLSIVQWRKNPDNQQIIARLIESGIGAAISDKQAVKIESSLAGKRICVTGGFDGRNREDIEAMIEQFGGVAVSSVSKKTDLLIVGEKAGTKLDKANELGVRTISLGEFLEMIEPPESESANPEMGMAA